MKRFNISAAAITSAALLAAACAPIQTRNEVVIKQEKPLEVNVNLHADINVVITDARKDLEQITGQKAIRNVSPADIGLDLDTSTVPTTSTPAATGPTGMVAEPMVVLADAVNAAPRALAADDDLKAAMAGRNAQVRTLLSTHNAGESHTGLLAERGTLTAEQSTLVAAENKDRTALYGIEAQKKGIGLDKVALSYYLARLSYAQKGDWYEKFNKAAQTWEWATWDK